MKKLIYLFVASVITLSCNSVQKNYSDNSAANINRMQEFYDQVMNAHNPAMVDSFITPDIIDHQMDPHYPAGLPGIKAMFTDYFAAFPDMHFKTNFIKAWGDTVMADITMTATNSGPFMGMPATNKQINIDGVDIVVLKDGKAKEHWGYQEESKMMAQLGMGQAPPADSSMNKK